MSSEPIDRLKRHTVGIAGAGGLGSNVAQHLVRSGIRRLVIADPDKVEPVNLNRQFYFRNQAGRLKVDALAENLKRIAPDLRLTTHAFRLNKDNLASTFAPCDVIVEAFDDAAAKKMLIETVLPMNRFLVAVSGIGGWGDPESIRVRRIKPGFYVVGDGTSPCNETYPPLSPRVGIAAAMQADLVLGHLMGTNTAGPAKQPDDRCAWEPGPRSVIDTDIYCLTAEKFSLGRSNIDVVKEMIAAGVRVIQYREKNKALAKKYEECRVIREMTRDAGVRFIVNDDVDLAMMVSADGVHVGQDDWPVAAVRKLVGPNMAIGLSTHSPEQARAAMAAGIDYIGVGPIFQTATKEDVCAPVGFDYLDFAVEHVNIPFVAIGGIKDHNLSEVVKRGAGCVAMVTEIVAAPDIEAKINELRQIIDQAKRTG